MTLGFLSFNVIKKAMPFSFTEMFVVSICFLHGTQKFSQSIKGLVYFNFLSTPPTRNIQMYYLTFSRWNLTFKEGFRNHSA